MLNYDVLPTTNQSHYTGDLLIFDAKLTAIGGRNEDYEYNRKVEVFQNGTWDDVIPQVGNENGRINHFTSLAIDQQLYVFGKKWHSSIL